MPLYEYYCERCGDTDAILRPIRKRNFKALCSTCSTPRIRIASVPSIDIWNQERKFPNLKRTGDGTMTFASKTDYNIYLKENNIAEVSQGGRVSRPHGNKVVMTYG